MRKIIIDTDAGSDDAVALAVAMNQKDIEILGITTVAGNCDLYQATQNALMTIEYCNKNISVYSGCSQPFLREQKIDAVQVHGKDGMGDLNLINPKTCAEETHAVDFIIDSVKKYPDEIEIITIGPLTNIAVAIAKDPEVMEKVKHYYVMGTSGLGPGNASAVAEFNIYADAESFDIFLRKSKVDKTIIGFDVCIDNFFNKEEIEEISDKNKLGKFLMDSNNTLIKYNIRRLKEEILDLPDAVAVGAALWPEIILESKMFYAACCYKEPQTYGQVIFNDSTDALAVEHVYLDNNVTLITAIDGALFKNKLYVSL
ncbi:nucleoside hydrolase [Lactococcus lactis]|uniref:nucleoside hydrolase n=1 Tax=Lactococcus lactis TaxID=1358 RepID=UPI0032E4C2E4